MMPKRIQRRRTKGWKMPEGAVYVGRPTKWGNPFRVGGGFPKYPLTAEAAVTYFLSHLEHGCFRVSIAEVIRELRGKDLACWCPLDKPCHADVLLELANK